MFPCAISKHGEGIVPIFVNDEAIILEVRSISRAEDNATKLTFDDGHLYLIGKVAKVGSLSKTWHIPLF